MIIFPINDTPIMLLLELIIIVVIAAAPELAGWRAGAPHQSP